MEPNVRIEQGKKLASKLEGVLGAQEKPPGECPLCRESMDAHTVLVEEVELGRAMSSQVRPIGWACPRQERPAGAVEPEEELRWIADQLKATGAFHEAIQQRLDVLSAIITERASKVGVKGL